MPFLILILCEAHTQGLNMSLIQYLISSEYGTDTKKQPFWSTLAFLSAWTWSRLQHYRAKAANCWERFQLGMERTAWAPSDNVPVPFFLVHFNWFGSCFQIMCLVFWMALQVKLVLFNRVIRCLRDRNCGETETVKKLRVEMQKVGVGRRQGDASGHLWSDDQWKYHKRGEGISAAKVNRPRAW